MLRILITAGPTREHLDPVRYISNESSGRMGFELAAVAVERGHRVTLVHGPVTLPVPPGVEGLAVVSAEQMLAACVRVWPEADVLIAAAAVADYRPARRAPHKLKKQSQELVLRLEPTPDVLRKLALDRRPDQVAIGFALEDRDGRANATRKLHDKRLDAVVLNSPAAIGVADSGVELLTADGWESFPAQPKRETASRLIELAERMADARRTAGE